MNTGVSYFGNRMPRHFRERDLPEIVAMGCSYIVHTFSESDSEFYADAVGEMLQDTKAAGMEAFVDPWGLGGLFAGESYSRFLLNNPHSWQVDSRGGRIPIACPSAPEFRSALNEWIHQASRLGADAIFWDDPGVLTWVNDSGSCYCANCNSEYQNRYGGPIPVDGSSDSSKFRGLMLTELLSEACLRSKQLGIKNAIGLISSINGNGPGYEWEDLAAIDSVDILASSPFWHLWDMEVDQFVSDVSRDLVAVCKNYDKEPMIWIQGFSIANGREEEVGRAIDATVVAGIDNIAVWGFRACEHMRHLRPDRPSEVWNTVTRSFRRHNRIGP